MPRKRSKPAKPRKRPPRRTRQTRDLKREEEAFTRSLIAHGQAAKAGPDGKLPAGATHELVEDDKGEPKLVRRRFSSVRLRNS
jgi:hypothetical protein